MRVAGSDDAARADAHDAENPAPRIDLCDELLEAAMDALFVSGDADRRVFERTGIPVE